jgi:acyl carrier protein
MLSQITEIICRAGEIPSVGDDEDFRDAGVASVNELMVLMELEDAFGISIPDEAFMRARTARQLGDVIGSLNVTKVA